MLVAGTCSRQPILIKGRSARNSEVYVPASKCCLCNKRLVRARSSKEGSQQAVQDISRSSPEGNDEAESIQEANPAEASSRGGLGDAEKKVSSFVRNTATTFAPRASTAVKNPAFKGSTLYAIFGAQAWLSILVGGLLSFNVIFPTDRPSIARLIGMWSIWMFTIPAWRARECTAIEKEALNLLFLLIPLLNVGLPFVWKSFPFIFTADCAAMAAVYLWKIGLPSSQKDD